MTLGAWTSSRVQRGDVRNFLLLFAAYFVVSRIGSLLFFRDATYVIWTSAGVGLAGLFLAGNRMWPAIALAIVASSYLNGNALPLIAVACVGNVGQALAGAGLLRHWEFDGRLSRLRDIVVLMLVGGLSATIAPTIGTAGRWLLDASITSLDATTFWASWWVAGVVSILILTPLIVTWVRRRKIPIPPACAREAALGLLALVIIAGVLFWTPTTNIGGIPLIYLLLLPLFWLGLRTEPRIVTLANAVLMGIGITGVAFGQNVIPADRLGYRMVQTELFFAILASMILVVLAVTEERHAATRALEKHIGQLERALARIRSEDQAKSDFIAILGHELRNPLTPVVTYLALLRRMGPGAPEAPGYLSIIENNIRTVTRLLDDLLDISRINREQFPLHREPVRLQEILRRSVTAIEPMVRSGERQLSVALPEDDLVVSGDAVRIEQIFVNLLNNAVKYTGRGGQIFVTAHRRGAWITVTVGDDGVGIDPAHLQSIFEPFTRGGDLAQMPSGLGIGLYLSRQLAELHGGTIVARSNGLGKGSEFVVELPSREVRLTTAAGPLAAGSRESTSTPRSVPETSRAVLVVDDNHDAADGLGLLLAGRGHRIRVAYEGHAALSLLESFNPDAVILDIGLPGMDGYELARAVRTRRGDAVVLIAVTGYGQEEDKRRAHEAGFNHHLTKPVDGADLDNLLAVPATLNVGTGGA
jgi:signal transduction histidine kinase/CheY-like chemotaxis protein